MINTFNLLVSACDTSGLPLYDLSGWSRFFVEYDPVRDNWLVDWSGLDPPCTAFLQLIQFTVPS